MDSIIEKEKNKTNNSISSFFSYNHYLVFKKFVFLYFWKQNLFFYKFFLFFLRKKKHPMIIWNQSEETSIIITILEQRFKISFLEWN